MDNLTQKHLLYTQFAAWASNGSVAPMTDYINNPNCQEIIDEENYNGVRIYIDLKASFGYTNEAEKLKRNDSKINLGITLRLRVLDALSRGIFVHFIQKWPDSTEQNIRHISTKRRLPRMNRKQSVRGWVWYMVGMKKKLNKKDDFYR